jgi:hypothetical protein
MIMRLGPQPWFSEGIHIRTLQLKLRPPKLFHDHGNVAILSPVAQDLAVGVRAYSVPPTGHLTNPG